MDDERLKKEYLPMTEQPILCCYLFINGDTVTGLCSM